MPIMFHDLISAIVYHINPGQICAIYATNRIQQTTCYMDKINPITVGVYEQPPAGILLIV